MRAIRILTRSGAIRVAVLAPYPDLLSWWLDIQVTGHVIGSHWAMPVDNIAIADLVEIPEDESQSARPARDQQTFGMAHAIESGAWKPPSGCS